MFMRTRVKQNEINTEHKKKDQIKTKSRKIIKHKKWRCMTGDLWEVLEKSNGNASRQKRLEFWNIEHKWNTKN